MHLFNNTVHCPATSVKPDEILQGKNKKIEFIFYLARELYLKLRLRNWSEKQICFPKSPKSIIVAAGGNLGGTILTLPLIKVVRERWPHSHLAVIVNGKSSQDIISLSNYADSCHLIYPISLLDSIFQTDDFKREYSKLKELNAEIAITNHDNGLEHLLMLLKTPIRIGHVGMGVSGNSLVWGNVNNLKVPCKVGKNWLESYSDLARIFTETPLSTPSISVDKNDNINAIKEMENDDFKPGSKFVAIQAGVWEKETFKQWPLKFLAQTCLKLYEKYSFFPIIIGVRGQEITHEAIRRVLPEHVPVIDLIGKTSTKQVAAILSQCSVTITNDSGLMHLSAALGIPTVAIYGMTDPSVTWCYGIHPKYQIVRNRNAVPCYVYGHNFIQHCLTRYCLTSITPQMVIDAVGIALEANI